MSIGQAADRLEISEATISRFARHMGCQDFKELKNVVIRQNHLEGPAGKLASTLLSEESFQALSYLQKQQVCLQKTMERLDRQEFEKALEAFLKARQVFIHAKSASASMGQLLFPPAAAGRAGDLAAFRRLRSAGGAGAGRQG